PEGWGAAEALSEPWLTELGLGSFGEDGRARDEGRTPDPEPPAQLWVRFVTAPASRPWAGPRWLRFVVAPRAVLASFRHRASALGLGSFRPAAAPRASGRTPGPEAPDLTLASFGATAVGDRRGAAGRRWASVRWGTYRVVKERGARRPVIR